MALLLLLILTVSMFAVSDSAWCVCRTDVSTAAQQKALDYACGAGADCTPILQNGACYNPNTVTDHCSYAANSYYQRKGQDPQACDFAGTAILKSTDPSTAGCTYPATPSAAGTSSTSTSTSTGTSNITSGTPSTFTPSTGVLGLGPTGTSSNLDDSQSSPLRAATICPFVLTIFLSSMASLRI